MCIVRNCRGVSCGSDIRPSFCLCSPMRHCCLTSIRNVPSGVPSSLLRLSRLFPISPLPDHHPRRALDRLTPGEVIRFPAHSSRGGFLGDGVLSSFGYGRQYCVVQGHKGTLAKNYTPTPLCQINSPCCERVQPAESQRLPSPVKNDARPGVAPSVLAPTQ